MVTYNQKFFSKVFMYLCIGLIVTFITGYLASTNANFLVLVYNDKLYITLALLEIVIALILSACLYKLNTIVATILYFVYAILTGATLSSIFIVYEASSIIWIVLVSAIVFGVFAVIGINTKKIYLNSIGTFLTMGLAAIIILEIINIFLLNSVLDIVLCAVGLMIFMGYVAYDIQIIYRLANVDNASQGNLAIIGAFSLYLDFINIFIRLIRLFGKRRR